MSLAAQVREAKMKLHDIFWQCCFASRAKWVRRYIIQDTLKNVSGMCIYPTKNFVEKSSVFIEIWFFYMKCHGWKHWCTVIQAKRVTKPRFRRKILTFATGTVFHEFFCWKMCIIWRYYVQHFVSDASQCPGTKIKARLSKCIIAISFCVSCLSGEWHQIHNFACNTFLWCSSFKQKNSWKNSACSKS
jgi:hypothetical protein